MMSIIERVEIILVIIFAIACMIGVAECFTKTIIINKYYGRQVSTETFMNPFRNAQMLTEYE